MINRPPSPADGEGRRTTQLGRNGRSGWDLPKVHFVISYSLEIVFTCSFPATAEEAATP